MMRKSTCLIVLLMAAASANAQTPPPMERVLIPIFLIDEIPGALGSLWKSELVIVNNTDEVIAIDGIRVICNLGTCVPPPFFRLHANTAIFAKPHITRGVFPPTSFVLIERDRLGDVSFSLRIQDESRQALTWGTEIPIIPEREAFRGSIDLVNVPLDPRFRVLLRVYDYRPGPDHRIRVTGYSLDPEIVEPPNEPQPTMEVFSKDLTIPTGSSEPGEFEPGYAQIDLSELTTIMAGQVLIRIEPLTELTYWAFISVTNNETQHVTLITPQP